MLRIIPLIPLENSRPKYSVPEMKISVIGQKLFKSKGKPGKSATISIFISVKVQNTKITYLVLDIFLYWPQCETVCDFRDRNLATEIVYGKTESVFGK
jgi:hypothetical protein